MKISLVRLSTKDLATLTQRTIEASKNGKNRVSEPNLLLGEVEKIYADYDAVYTKQTFSGKGKTVAAADEERDRVFSMFRNFLWGYRQIPTMPNADKAEKLYQIIKSFGTDLNKLSYAEQTAQMKKLIEELEKPENKSMLKALGLEATFAELKQKQEDFETIFAEQATANADLRKLPSATAIRKSLEKSLRSYLDFLSVMQNLPQWNALYLEVSELVKAVLSLIHI